jgi:hypothetical protein
METVLKRDGVDVVTNTACAATSGSWYSVYDGRWNYASSDVDIDHVVALSRGMDGWGLSMDAAEKNAINDMLATC